MSLAAPWFLVLLPLYWVCRRFCRAHSKPLRLSNLDLAERALGRLPRWESWLRSLIVFLLVIALADPVSKTTKSLDRRKGHAIALLLDASYSMREGQRFKIAKEVLLSFVQKRKNDRMALELFADYAYLAAPMSFEKRGIEIELKAIEPGVVGGRDTALYAALFQGARLFKGEAKGNRVIILLTDGIDTVGDIPLDAAIKELKQKHIRVYTIGVGDDFKKEVLAKIAGATGGRFYDARQADKLSEIYKQIDRIESDRIKTVTITQTRHYAPLALILALVALLLLILLRVVWGAGAFIPLLALLLILYALLSPRLFSKRESKQEWVSLLVAIECSNSMDAKDLYPDRFHFALHKLRLLLDSSNRLRVGVLLFCKKSYLLVPPTRDHEAIKSMLDHLFIDRIERQGSNWGALLRSASNFSDQNSTLPLIVFSTGEGIDDCKLLAHGAKRRRLDLILIPAATIKGSTISDGKEPLRNERGDVIISRLSPKLSCLAKEAGGLYYPLSLDDEDIKRLAKRIVDRYSLKAKSQDSFISNQAPPRLPMLLALALLTLPWALWIRRRR